MSSAWGYNRGEQAIVTPAKKPLRTYHQRRTKWASLEMHTQEIHPLPTFPTCQPYITALLASPFATFSRAKLFPFELYPPTTMCVGFCPRQSVFCGGIWDVCFYVKVRGHEWSTVHAVVNSRKWALKRDYEKVVFDLLIELSCFFFCGSATGFVNGRLW